jgi:hypothetical protein
MKAIDTVPGRQADPEDVAILERAFTGDLNAEGAEWHEDVRRVLCKFLMTGVDVNTVWL